MNFRKCEICSLRSGRKDGTKRCFMARFPLDEARCKQWVKITGNEDLAYIPIKKLHELKFICGNHFKDQDFKKKRTQLIGTAVPSLRLKAKPLDDDVLVGFPFKMYSEQYLSVEESINFSDVSPVSNQKLRKGVSMEHDYHKVLRTTPEPSASLISADFKTSGHCKGTKLEVCIDSLESAINAVQGGADELEVCSSLAEGGLTPSAGLVKQIMELVKRRTQLETPVNNKKPKVNVMIRCRGGSDFCYTKNEMETMLADIEIYKEFGVDRFVFGALTSERVIDKENCTNIVSKAHPIAVTFHRAYDLCKEPKVAIEEIIDLGFNRILTSGQKSSAADETALQLLIYLLNEYNDKIEIMPGAGVNCDNAKLFAKSGFNIIHSSCKKLKILPNVGGELDMGSDVMYVTDENIVKRIKQIIEIN